MAHLDDKPDQEVFGEYGLRGFPTVLILDYDGAVLHGAEDYFRPTNKKSLDTALKKVSTLFDARSRAAKPNATELEKARLVLLEGLRKPAKADFEAMQKAAEVKGMDAELVAEFKVMQKRGPFMVIFRAYRAKYDGAKNDIAAKVQARQEALAKTYEIFKKGHVIEDPNDELHRSFWILAFDGAAAKKDLKLAERAYRSFKSVYANDAKYKSHVVKMEKKLAQLRG